MTITLNHTIVPSRDKQGAACLFSQLFGLSFEGVSGHFAPVRVNETLTLLFDDDVDAFESHHYAFYVDDPEFDAVLQRVQANWAALWQCPLVYRRRRAQRLERRPGLLLQGSRWSHH
jgi:hypothetical protein